MDARNVPSLIHDFASMSNETSRNSDRITYKIRTINIQRRRHTTGEHNHYEGYSIRKFKENMERQQLHQQLLKTSLTKEVIIDFLDEIHRKISPVKLFSFADMPSQSLSISKESLSI